ncbi:hypothetical protein R1sor_008723 [Riccia sorocarpa]|uniref:Uncharacterized protein n=1 Tax=Riccia sorocarpa TaxID=122646 RepID=A0ABD3HU82_9MARC
MEAYPERFLYRGLSRRQDELKEIGVMPPQVGSILNWLDFALTKAAEDTSFLFGFGVYIARSWEERNKLRFQNRRSRLPTRALLQQIFKEIDALPQKRISDSALQITTTARNAVGNWILTWSRRQQNQRCQGTDGEDYTQGAPSRSSAAVAERDSEEPRTHSATSSPSNQGPTQTSLDTADSSVDGTRTLHPNDAEAGPSPAL